MPAVKGVARDAILAPACRHSCTLGNVEKLLPRAVATGPFAESVAAVVRKAG